MAKCKPIEITLTGGDDLTGPLLQLINDSGMSRYEIAAEAGISKAILSHIDTGRRVASLEILRAVAEALGRKVTVRID